MTSSSPSLSQLFKGSDRDMKQQGRNLQLPERTFIDNVRKSQKRWPGVEEWTTVWLFTLVLMLTLRPDANTQSTLCLRGFEKLNWKTKKQLNSGCCIFTTVFVIFFLRNEALSQTAFTQTSCGLKPISSTYQSSDKQTAPAKSRRCPGPAPRPELTSLQHKTSVWMKSSAALFNAGVNERFTFVKDTMSRRRRE